MRTPPNPDAVAWVAHRLHRGLFATGAWGRAGRQRELDDTLELLSPEIVSAFAIHTKSRAEAERRTRRALASLARALPALRRILRRDLDAAYERDPAATGRLEIMLCYPGLRALSVHRVAHALHLALVPLIPRMLAESVHDSTGIDIHPGARIGPGFFIDHGTSVVIGETSIIGRDCTIYQGVTLGAKRFDRHKDGSIKRGTKRHPTLRDLVTVYANATILGGKTVIGKGAVISAGVLVQESVPARCTVKAPMNQMNQMNQLVGSAVTSPR
ncbi:MAG: serine acetyltransferase [Phycisphaerales bacterium]|nr:serine acetyltransferase [Phycisphaerales bacterium]